MLVLPQTNVAQFRLVDFILYIATCSLNYQAKRRNWEEKSPLDQKGLYHKGQVSMGFEPT